MESLSVTFLSSPFRSNISSSLTTRTCKKIFKNTIIHQKHRLEFTREERMYVSNLIHTTNTPLVKFWVSFKEVGFAYIRAKNKWANCKLGSHILYIPELFGKIGPIDGNRLFELTLHSFLSKYKTTVFPHIVSSLE